MTSIVDRAKAFVDEAKQSGDWGYNGPDVYELAEALDGEVIVEKAGDQSRWMVHYTYVIRAGDEYLRIYQGRGATEYQDGEDIYSAVDSFTEVEPVEVTVTEYRKKK